MALANLHLIYFLIWLIFTYIWSMVNLEQTDVLLFYYFVYLKVNLDLEKISLVNPHPTSFFAAVNLDPADIEKRWIAGESWPNCYLEKVNRGENLSLVGSRCPLMCAFTICLFSDVCLPAVFMRSRAGALYNPRAHHYCFFRCVFTSCVYAKQSGCLV